MQDAKQDVRKTDQHQVVTAVGNSWIVCKSKSHEGQTYYFNTLTGKAVWNLSDEEIERAKKRTKTLSDEAEESLKECPEPQEPPMDYNSNKRSHHYIYNKKVINNRFSNERYPIAAFVAPQCNYLVPPCHSGSQIGLNIPTQNYNPEVWSVPPTHQILIAPTISSMVSQSQLPANMQYGDQGNVSVQNTSIPLTRRFQNNNPYFNNSSHKSPKHFTGGHKFSPRKNFGQGKFQRKFRDKPNDLREILSSRRRQRHSLDSDRENAKNANESEIISKNFEDTEPVPCTSSEKKFHIQESKEDAYLSETESSWLEENVKVQGRKLNLDITCLRNLAAPNADPDDWYIAVDRTILLHHLNFLNMLIHSDEDCQLLVPREELSALREMASSAEVASRTPRLSNRARRALNFVLQQFDLPCGVQGEEIEANSTSSHILNCCLNVAEQNYHVILLSNDKELLAQRESSYITMFSMNELKAFLTKSKEEDAKIASAAVPPESAIKITIPNDFVKKTGKNITFASTSVSTEGPHGQRDSNTSVNNIDVKTAVNSLPATKLTIDTGVQTDFVAPTAEVKRREIRLRRSTSNQTSSNHPCSNQNKSVKKFRWRRKRDSNLATNDASNQTNSATMNISTRTSEDLEKVNDIESRQQASQLSAESGKQNYICDYENIEGSNTSSSVVMQKSARETIVIEETSTSGVISNTTASNHDSESITNEFPVQFQTRCNADEQDDSMKNNYMFKITSQQVEEYLKMRSDEWISRFVQIMEEVLSQLLQRRKPSSIHLTPPPWNLQEALQCILKSSDYYGDIKDAAEKLSSTLINISDEKGKINIELRPTDFMEMYSYGVYLVDALQGTYKDCEDLQTASESLVKLLKDIQEPNLDTSHNDTFGEQNQGLAIKVPHITDEQENLVNVDNTVNEIENTHYNLRSRKSAPLKQKEPPVANKVNLVQNIDVKTNFFTSLNLQKRISEEMGQSSQESGSLSEEFRFSRPADLIFEINGSNFDNEDNLEIQPVDRESTEVSNTKTKFIRRFSKSLEIEDRLSQREPLDLDELDYSANYDDNYQCMEDDYYNKVVDEYDKVLLVDQCDDDLVKEKDECIDERYSAQSLDINHNTVVCGIFQTLISEINGTMKHVQVFCENSDQQLRKVSLSVCSKKAIHDKAEKAWIVIGNIIKSLESVVYRETYQYQNSIQTLQTAGIEGFDLNDKMFPHYRDSITKCLAQANILHEAVGIIVRATKF